MFSWEQMDGAVRKACGRFTPLAARYPELRPYLVLCRLGAQASIPALPSSLLKDSPSMVIENGAKERALSILRQCGAARKWQGSSADKIAVLERSLDVACRSLLYPENILAEVRFTELVFESIWRMQADELVDRTLTPQTKASIRIVLCPLAALVSDDAVPESARARALDAATNNAPIDVSEDSDNDSQDDRETQGGRRTP